MLFLIWKMKQSLYFSRNMEELIQRRNAREILTVFIDEVQRLECPLIHNYKSKTQNKTWPLILI